MSGEADSGGDPAAPGTEPDDLEIDVQQEVDGTAPNTNYDSAEGAMPVLRCERCDSFETVSRAALVSHTAQCAAAGSGQTGGDLEADGSATTDDRNRHHRKMFECDVCNMKFSNGANMRRHKMRHTGVKPYECRVCQKRFFRKDHLAEHFSTHTKTLPFHCPICSRGFQRQIAMRAHFQNEHVGQHDLVKACPLCTYRAPTMKALRVHFFNRHGIDLDNPGPGSSGILGLPLSTTVSGPGLNVGLGDNSDSGDSTGNRSTDNATPPMHFLTPHVEISMADTEFHTDCEPRSAISSALDLATNRINGDPPVSPQSADSNAPSSSLSLGGHPHSSHIMPSISLIPIKQEPGDDYVNRKTKSEQESTTSCVSEVPSGSSSVVSKNTSLIKVSPLKSLLREDLRRKLSARVSSRANRTHEALPSEMPPVPTTTNGTITSTGSDSDISGWRRLNNGLMCHFCGIGFPDQTLYFLHKGCHSESNPWKCNICGEQCNNVYEFNSHLLSKSHQ